MTRLTGLYKNWNYAAPGTFDYERYLQEIRTLVGRHAPGGGDAPQAPTPEAGEDPDAPAGAALAETPQP